MCQYISLPNTEKCQVVFMLQLTHAHTLTYTHTHVTTARRSTATTMTRNPQVKKKLNEKYNSRNGVFFLFTLCKQQTDGQTRLLWITVNTHEKIFCFLMAILIRRIKINFVLFYCTINIFWYQNEFAKTSIVKHKANELKTKYTKLLHTTKW